MHLGFSRLRLLMRDEGQEKIVQSYKMLTDATQKDRNFQTFILISHLLRGRAEKLFRYQIKPHHRILPVAQKFP